LLASLANTASKVRTNVITDPKVVNATGWTGLTAGGNITGAFFSAAGVVAAPGEKWTASMDITAPPGSSLNGQFACRGTLANSFGAIPFTPTIWVIPAGQTQRITNTYIIPPTGVDGVRLYSTSSIVDGSGKAVNALLEKNNPFGEYFDGSMTAVDKTAYAWTGTVNASTSTATTSYSISVNDAISTALTAAPGKSIVDLERARLLTALGLTEPPYKNYSLYDLYSMKGEKPRLKAFRG